VGEQEVRENANNKKLQIKNKSRPAPERRTDRAEQIIFPMWVPFGHALAEKDGQKQGYYILYTVTFVEFKQTLTKLQMNCSLLSETC
jgi:hypothetical protein